jgi:uroporphyrinogen III methyltransferase/synthase
VLVARAAHARDVLPEGLAERGYGVDLLVVYRTVAATPDPDALARVQRGQVDAVTFTSSSTVRNFVDIVDAPHGSSLRVFSIGPVTSQTARDLGLVVAAEATEHTIAGLVATVLEHLSPPTK